LPILRLGMRTAEKQAEIEFAARMDPEWLRSKPFAPAWGSRSWVKWATVMEVFARLGIGPGASILDVGCGGGWTTAFLAEAGFLPVGVDIAPAALDVARERAQRWEIGAEFVEADVEDFWLARTFDAALVYDALHHCDRVDRVVANVARHLRPGGWVLFGEPSWLHRLSPIARYEHRETGRNEHGIRLSRLKSECRRAGLGDFRRFFEGTRPYEGRLTEFAWQTLRLAAANLWVAPKASVWLAARKR
jgi:SAM-dependent methyltransferase